MTVNKETGSGLDQLRLAQVYVAHPVGGHTHTKISTFFCKCKLFSFFSPVASDLRDNFVTLPLWPFFYPMAARLSFAR